MAIGDVRIISARRSFEFVLDDIRLTVLSIPTVRQRMQQVFGFQIAQVGQPMATFGNILNTIPPGLVFDYGAIPAGEESPAVPIRFFHVEPQRIVVDVSGPTQAAEAIFRGFVELVKNLHAPDGSPALGQPTAIRDYSEIVFSASRGLDRLFSRSLRKLFQEQLGMGSEKSPYSLVPAVELRIEPTAVPYSITDEHGVQSLRLELRAGSAPGQFRLFSGAPMPTEAHIAYLEQLDLLLSKA